MHKWITFPHREGVCSKQAHADFPEEAIYEREAVEVGSSAQRYTFITNTHRQVGLSGRATCDLAHSIST